jgi:hypothetical protein
MAIAILFIPGARPGPNARCTSSLYDEAFSPCKVMCCINRVWLAGRSANTHLHRMTAPSKAISIVYESCGLTSRSRHCRGACPGISVVPSDPLVNDQFNPNSAGGSSQFLTSVIYIHVNAGVAVVSTECSIAHFMSLVLRCVHGSFYRLRSRHLSQLDLDQALHRTGIYHSYIRELHLPDSQTESQIYSSFTLETQK